MPQKLPIILIPEMVPHSLTRKLPNLEVRQRAFQCDLLFGLYMITALHIELLGYIHRDNTGAFCVIYRTPG